MTTDNFTDAARAYAERQYPALNPDAEELTYPRSALREHKRSAHVAGWKAARTHLTEQEPTDAEQAARFAVESKHHLHGTQCLCGFESHQARSRTEHIMTHYFDELSAAHAARRDEEKQDG